jgi:hypothetical protein
MLGKVDAFVLAMGAEALADIAPEHVFQELWDCLALPPDLPTGDDTDARRVCEETLGLTKMNWNSAMIGGRNPITLEMASKVGPIMAEVPEEQEPEMSFRYYM